MTKKLLPVAIVAGLFLLILGWYYHRARSEPESTVREYAGGTGAK